jgi:hypothetical protein
VSPRRNRPKGAARSGGEDRPGRYGGFQSTQMWQGEEWYVRHVAGASAQGKTYRCPGCDQVIPDKVPHVVAWPEYAGVDERRHWHTSCWNAKDRCTTRVQRSRNAPRH